MSKDKIPYIQGYELGGYVDNYKEEYNSGIYVPSYSTESFKHHDQHSVVTIALNELIDGNWLIWYTEEDGNVIPNPSWVWDYYNLNQYKRVCDKFNDRYFWDEISLIPPLKWKQQVVRKFNEIMPKYKLIYEAIDNGVDPLQVSSSYGKGRNIFSEFPETLLNGNSDYVSNGTDNEFERIDEGDVLEKFSYIATRFNDVDVMILNEFEDLFSSLYTVNVNGW